MCDFTEHFGLKIIKMLNELKSGLEITLIFENASNSSDEMNVNFQENFYFKIHVLVSQIWIFGMNIPYHKNGKNWPNGTWLLTDVFLDYMNVFSGTEFIHRSNYWSIKIF